MWGSGGGGVGFEVSLQKSHTSLQTKGSSLAFSLKSSGFAFESDCQQLPVAEPWQREKS